MTQLSIVRRCTNSLTLAVTLLGFVGEFGASANAQAPNPSGVSGYHLETSWKPGGDGGWDYLLADSTRHRLYVTRTDRVQVIDTESGSLVGEITGIEGGHGVALASEFKRGFITSGKSNTVIVFDLETLKAVGEPVKVGRKPDAIVYDPTSKHVFSFDGERDQASVIDAASARVIATIPLGGGPEFAAVDGAGMLYVNLEDKSETLAIDTKANTISHRWPLAPGESPSGLAIDVRRGRLFAGCHNEKMAVLNTADGKVLGSPSIGKGVDACAFDPATGFAFASCGDGTLTVIKESEGGFHVVETLHTKTGARTMALDPETHAIYLAAAEFMPAPTPAPGQERQRPKMIPGTFTILKYVR